MRITDMRNISPKDFSEKLLKYFGDVYILIILKIKRNWDDKKLNLDQNQFPPLSLRTKWRVDSFWML
jgi:hypothetical protein